MPNLREATKDKDTFMVGTPTAMWDSGEIVKKKKRYRGSNKVWMEPDEDTQYPMGKVNSLPNQRGRRI